MATVESFRQSGDTDDACIARALASDAKLLEYQPGRIYTIRGGIINRAPGRTFFGFDARLLTETLQLGGVQLGAQLLEVGGGLVDVALGIDEVGDRQRRQLGDAHGREVGGEDGQIAHGHPPHWYTRVKVECRETRRSKASISEIR
jgi:hypothetical protein